jgi:hypothetical protein
MQGRDANGRFVAGWSPDRGRGRAPSSIRAAIDPALHEMVLEIANLPISIARGRGRRVVTLYEAQIRRLASGRVHRRASVMDFIRLVQAAAVMVPATPPNSANLTPHLPLSIVRLQELIAQLRDAAEAGEPMQDDKTGLSVCELLLEAISTRPGRRRASSRLH